MSASPGSVQSVERVLDLVEALSAVPQGMALSELAAATGLHVSTAHRLVGALVGRGYACKDRESGKYRLTLRLFEVGSQVSKLLNLHAAVRPLLDKLAAACQEVVHLAEWDGTEMVYLYKVEPSRPMVRTGSYVGCRNPMYCTGVGKSVLAFLPDEEVANIWASSRICAYTEHTITQLDALRADLAQVRRRGYAIDDEEHEPGVRCIAVPVFGWAGRPVAAVSVAAPVFRMGDEVLQTLFGQMKQLAVEAGQLLGCVPGEDEERRR